MNLIKKPAEILKKLHLGYFLTTVLILGFLTMFCAVCSALAVIITSEPYWLEMGIIYAAVSFGCGFWRTTTEKRKFERPSTLLGICAPHLFLFLWTMLLYAQAAEQDYDFQWFNLWHNFLLMDGLAAVVGVHLAGLGFFLLGERLCARKHGIVRSMPTLKSLGLLAAFIAVCSGGALYGRFYHDMTTVTMSDDEGWEIYDSGYNTATEGYGFPYENGWSSVDLEPYYVENPENLLPEIESSTFRIADVENMPVLDGAEAAYPVYSAFANACYENIAEIQRTTKENHTSRPITFTNTVEAYKSLIAGDVDIFFGAQPSQAQLDLAEEAGVELEMTPIGKEGFVFFVSTENPVDGLTSEQIRKMYSGKISNWIQVGGNFVPVLAFQRPENSGSQTMMQHFMGDVPLKKPVASEYENAMFSVIKEVANYDNKASSIGYSFRYYASQMVFEESEGIKLLELDGIYPDAESIRDGSYPMTTQLYAITVKGNPNPNVSAFTDWMVSEQGQEIVAKTGYVTLE